MNRTHSAADYPEILLDTSSAILLHKVALFPQLLNNYRTGVTASVYDELTVKNKTSSNYFTTIPKNSLQIIVRKETEPLDEELEHTKKLDRGEYDTILAYMEGNSKFIITDDKKAAQVCKKNNIPFINALMVPRILFNAGALSVNRFFNATTNLMEIGRYSQKIMDYSQKCPTADLIFFFPELDTKKKTDWRVF